MCGIVGIVGNNHKELIHQMNDQIIHRGPDAGDVYHVPEYQLSLGMRRLSILDLSGGLQPMESAQGEACIVYNGEIFNSPEIRQQLESDGVRFKTQNSDTEAILQFYLKSGEGVLDSLNGMFAFSIYDRKKKCLFGARDPLGIKPLYVMEGEGFFAFASELKSLIKIPGFNRTLDLEAIYHYFSLLYIPGPQSIFKSVRRIAPGHAWSYDLEKRTFKTWQYWKPNFQGVRNRSAKEWEGRIRREFTSAVDRWTLSDVPVGSSLSGGIDSCAITGLMAERPSSKLRTYTVGFKDQEDHTLDETRMAERFAAHLGTEHRTERIEAKQVISDLLKMVWHLDEPYAGGLPSWYVYKLMAEDLKVGMTGSGGDELFSNYGYFSRFEVDPFLRRYMRVYPALKRFFPGIIRGRDRLQYPIGSGFEAFKQYWNDQDKQSILFRDARFEAFSSQKLVQEVYDAAQGRNTRDGIANMGLTRQLPEEFLMVTDRFSMAHSLEARTPFLDRRFVELALTIPSEIRIGSYDLKYLFKSALSDVIPAEVMRGKKYGFVLPLGRWLRGELKQIMIFFLSAERLEKQGIFRPDFWSTTVVPHLSGKSEMTYRIWPMLMFQIWHYLWVELGVTECPTGDLFDLIGAPRN